MIQKSEPVTQKMDKDAFHNLKVDTMSHTIINNVREELRAKGMKNPSTSVIIRELRNDSNKYKLMCAHLQSFAGEHGENEEANEVLVRLLHELRQLRAVVHQS